MPGTGLRQEYETAYPPDRSEILYILCVIIHIHGHLQNRRFLGKSRTERTGHNFLPIPEQDHLVNKETSPLFGSPHQTHA